MVKQKLKVIEIIQLNRQSYSQSKDAENNQSFNEEDSKCQNSKILKQKNNKQKTNINTKLLNIQKLISEDIRFKNDQNINKLISISNNINLFPNQFYQLNNTSLIESNQLPYSNMTPHSFIGYEKKSQNKILNLIEEVSDNISLGVAIFNSCRELIYTNNTMSQHFIQVNSQKKSIKQELLLYSLDNKNVSSLALKVNSQKMTKIDGGINRSTTMGPSIRLIQNSSQAIKQFINPNNCFENCEFLGGYSEKLKKSFVDLEDKNLNRNSSKKKTNFTQSNENFEHLKTNSIFFQDSDVRFGKSNLLASNKSIFVRGSSLSKVNLNKNHKIKEKLNSGLCTLGELVQIITDLNNYRNLNAYKSAQVLQYPSKQHPFALKRGKSQEDIYQNENNKQNIKQQKPQHFSNLNADCANSYQSLEDSDNFMITKIDYQIQANQVIVTTRNKQNEKILIKFKAFYIREQQSTTNTSNLNQPNLEISQNSYINNQLDEVNSDQNIQEDEEEYEEFKQQQLTSSNIIVIIEFIKNILFGYDLEHEDTKDEINNYKKKILSSVSHELKTPLNCSIQLLDLLYQSDAIDEIQKKMFIEPALNSNQLLLCMINDILDFALIEKGELKLTFKSFSIIDLIRECISYFIIQAASKDIQIELNFDQNIPQIIHSDEMRVKQVVISLLSNAIKFTQCGTISISVDCILLPNPTQPASEIIKITVADTGCGIEQQVLKNIFDGLKYKQDSPQQSYNYYMDSTKKRSIQHNKDQQKKLNTEGVGLGLTIANNIAKGLGGNRKIEVSSQIGKGSTFSFYIVNRSQKSRGCEINNYKFMSQSFSQWRSFQSKEMSDQVSLNDNYNSSYNKSEDISNHAHSNGLITNNLNCKGVNPRISLSISCNNIENSNRNLDFDEIQVDINNSQQISTKSPFKVNKPRNLFFQNQQISNKYQSVNESQQLSINNQLIQEDSCEIMSEMNSHKHISLPNHPIIPTFFSSYYQVSQLHNNNTDVSLKSLADPQISQQDCFPQSSNKQIRIKDLELQQMQNNFQIFLKNVRTSFSIQKINTNSMDFQDNAKLNTQGSQYKQDSNNGTNACLKINKNNYQQSITSLKQIGGISCKVLPSQNSNQNLQRVAKNTSISNLDQNNNNNSSSIANSGIEAINKVQEKFEKSSCCKQHKLIFMDIDMPIKNGYQTTKEILNYYNNQKVKPTVISACTAFIQESEKKQAKESGMKYYITKPVATEQLEEVLFKVFLQKKL
ncbi:hypothetical protein ABPG74_009737 [Tetrahymena malaccensis]